MIKANELRIGNLLYSDSSRNPTVFRVMGVDIESDRAKMKGNPAISDVELIYMVPIPLTPEWLERCELVKIEDEFADVKVWSKSLIEIGLKDGKFYLHSSCTDPWYNQTIGNAIEFVHQLQNLYFALTGEELNVKL